MDRRRNTCIMAILMALLSVGLSGCTAADVLKQLQSVLGGSSTGSSTGTGKSAASSQTANRGSSSAGRSKSTGRSSSTASRVSSSFTA